MHFFFFFWIFYKSSSVANKLAVNFTDSDIYLHIYSDRVEVRKTSAIVDTNLLGKYDNVEDGKIYLHLEANIDPNEKSSLIYYVNVKAGVSAVDVDVTIENINKSITFPIYVRPHNKKAYNSSITFHVESANSLEFESYYDGTDLTVYTINDNLLITHVLPKFKRNNYIICYNSLQCTQREDISIQPEDTYLSAVTETQLQGYVNTLISSTNIENIKFYFIEPIETANLTPLPFNQIETIELIGFSKETPQKVHFDDNSMTKYTQNWIIQNVQFSGSETASFYFETVLIKDTEKVFLEGPKFFINTAREQRSSKSGKSPFLDASEINLSIFEISPSFDLNGDLTVLSKSDIISVNSQSGDVIATIPLTNAKETEIFIQNAENKNKNKIFIKPENANRPFNFYIEKSDCILFEFSEWNDPKYSNYQFTFFTEKSEDISVMYVSSQLFQYKHFNFEKSRLFSEFPILEKKFIFCLSSDVCDQPDFDGPDILPIPISGSSLSEVTTNFHSKLKEIENIDVLYFYLFLTNNDNGIEIDLSPYLKGENLEKVGFINVDDSEVLNVNMKSLPKHGNNLWEINKCNLILNSSVSNYNVAELESIDGGRFTGEQVLITQTNYLENIDLSLSDQKIMISSSSFSYLNNVAKNSDTMKLRIKTGTNPHDLIFQHEDFAEETRSVEIDVEGFDDENKYIPVRFPENWHEIPNEKIGPIRINVLSNEHIAFHSLTDKVNFHVYTKETTPRILAQIPLNSDKIVICLESDQCSSQSKFEINEDEIFISTQRNDEFEQTMQMIFSNENKFYKFVRFSLIGRASQDYEIPFQLIPNDKFEQLQLYGYQIGYNVAYVLLNNETETNHIKKWLINKINFRQATGTKTQYFDDFIVDGGTTSIFVYSNNVQIGTAHFICKTDYYVTGLTGLNNKVDRIVYDIDSLSTKDYVIQLRASTIYLDGSLTSEYTGNPTISSPVSQNLYFHIIGESLNDHKLYIKRCDRSTTFTSINLIIDQFDQVLPVRFECLGAEVSKEFKYNFFTTNDGFYQIDEGTCTNCVVNSTKFQAQPIPSQSKTPSESPSKSPTASFTPTESASISPSFSPTETPRQSNSPTQSPFPLRTPVDEEPITTINSSSNVFEMTEIGYVDNQNETQEIDNQTMKITSISFSQKSIEIKESSVFVSSQPLYFIAEKEDSKIIINEKVTESNIGIYSDKNPTVVVSKEETPLSFMNRLIDGGNITISTEEESITDLKFKELNNQKGQFVFNVPSKIQSISLTTLIMQFYSQLKIRRLSSQSNLALLENDDDIEYANLVVLKNFTVSPQSFVTVNNLILNGSLFINTDSTLVVEDSIQFAKDSSIEISVSDPKVYQKNMPIFSIGKGIENKPKKIVFIPNNFEVNVSLIKGNGLDCDDFIDFLFVRENGVDEPIENASCDASSGEIVLSFYEVKKEKKSKLSTGAIIGIVVACVAVVAIIVIVAILLMKRKKNIKEIIEEDNDEVDGADDSIGL